MTNFSKTQFIKSAINKDGFLFDDKQQVCFVGRSNVGKSSLINMLCNQKSLARTSSTPGRTRLVNYFLVDDKFYLVDLPGYGFQKGSKAEQEDWDEMMDDYFTNTRNLRLALVLLDIRRDLTREDLDIQKYLFANNIPFKIVLTKTDKVSNNEKFVRIRALCEQLRYNKEALVFTSADKKLGREELIKLIDCYLED